MSHDTFPSTSSTPSESEWGADDDWGSPRPETSTSVHDEWNPQPESGAELPKRQGRVKRLGGTAANMLRRRSPESETAQTDTEQPVADGEILQKQQALEAAKASLEAANAALAERNKFFDSQQDARLPKADGSGFSNPIRKRQLSPFEIEQAKHFDAQKEHSAIARAQADLAAAEAAMGDVNRRSWQDVSEPTVTLKLDQSDDW